MTAEREGLWGAGASTLDEPSPDRAFTAKSLLVFFDIDGNRLTPVEDASNLQNSTNKRKGQPSDPWCNSSITMEFQKLTD